MSVDVKEIADGLTKAQRRAILALPENGWRTTKELGVSGSTMRALWDRWHGEYGLGVPYSLVHRDVCDQPLCYIYELSAEGLAVRNHLLATEPTA